MTKCSDLTALLGHAVLFIGNECVNWTIADFEHAAKQALALGYDGISPKRVNGTARWYGTPAHLAQELQAVEALGCHYVPFSYCYGPAVSSAQITQEVNVLAEVQSVCHGVVVADMETEWNGQVGAAQQFAAEMSKHAMGVLIISTWADPNEQNWQGVIHALHGCVDAWWPQQYDTWLAARESEFIKLGETCILPSIVLTNEVGPNDPVGIVKDHVARGVTTISVWEYQTALQNTEIAKAVAAVMPQQGEVMKQINVTDPMVAQFFTQAPGNAWTCTVSGHQFIIGNAMLDFYRTFMGQDVNGYCGLSYIGLPLSSEVPIPTIPGATAQRMERAVILYDPQHQIDTPPGVGQVYLAHLYNNGIGTDPRLSAAMQQVTTLTQQLADCQKSQPVLPALSAVQQIKSIVAPF